MTDLEKIVKALDVAIDDCEWRSGTGRKLQGVDELAAAAPVLRAHRARLERERAFVEAAKDYCGYWPAPTQAPSDFQSGWASAVSGSKNRLLQTYRAMMEAERE